MAAWVRAERDHYDRQLEQANLAITGAVAKTAKEILELATDANSLWKAAPRHERVKYLKKVCSNPILEGQTIRYDLRKPFKLLANMRGKEDWWTRVDEFRTAILEYGTEFIA